ncbi:MAG: hypothetical protein QOE69_2099 [Thermoleophilaceae bacterium]|jgi:hypothetical protein|nr:hypothetical protein [Thermoleophilaceae bacterium]
MVLVSAGAAQAAPTLSTSNRLDDRRYVESGARGYVVGSEAGRFPASGWHIRGEMGGVWTPPLKLLDGIWFGIDGHWIGPATRFTSGYGHSIMDLPPQSGVELTRTDFVPDGMRAALFGLTLRSSGGARTVTVMVDAHSELLSAYPWGWTTPNATTFNEQDSAGAEERRVVFSEPRGWTAVVGAREKPLDVVTGPGFRGPQEPPVICPSDGPAPPRCDDSAAGKGMGGRLRYRVSVPARGTRTLWLAVAGSDRGRADALAQHRVALADPDAQLRAKIDRRERLAAWTRVSLPGDRLLQQGIEWSKQNLADSVQAAEDLQVRWTDEGKQYPPPDGVVPRVRFFGAGFPDYPWLFATDGEFTGFAAVAAGQFEPLADHLKALRDVSVLVNPDTSKVVHEVVTEGSVYFGANEDAGNTDETAKFPSALALLWRWNGDNGLRDQLYPFAVRGMHWVVEQMDADGDGWPEGLGNVERAGMGAEKLDVTTATIRGLYDLADMAAAKGDAGTLAWARSHARSMESAFEAAWWMPQVPQHADSLEDPGDVKVQQRHWIGVTPMEIELVKRGRVQPGLSVFEHGNAALELREKPCFGNDFGLFHTGEPGCDGGPPGKGEKQIFSLNTAVMAVGEGNYGRLGPAQQQRFTTANRRLQLPDPDEQPGAMPEIAPSPDYGRSIDRPFYDRAMVLQAWGNYGTLWPVVHQQLGVRPDLGRRRLELTPQVPQGQSRLAGENVRLGGGAVDVAASRSGRVYRTAARLRVSLARFVIGHTLPRGSRVKSVRLDGRRVPYRTRLTNRGIEVLVRAPASGRHELVVRAR